MAANRNLSSFPGMSESGRVRDCQEGELTKEPRSPGAENQIFTKWGIPAQESMGHVARRD
jgi:hypothetical protein